METKEKVTATFLAVALAVTPAALIHKIEQDKIETLQEYYEILLQEERDKAYLEGYIDGLYGPEDDYFEYVRKGAPELKKETVKQLIKTKV